MGKAYILSPKVSDSLALVASDAASGSSVGNLQTVLPGQFWLSSTTSPYITCQNTGAAPFLPDTLILGYVVAGAGDICQLRIAETEAGVTSAPSTDETFYLWPDYGHGPDGGGIEDYVTFHRQITFPADLATWTRLDFAISSGASSVQIGRLLYGKRIEPECSVREWTPSFDEVIAETLDLGGEKSPRYMGVRRGLEVVWHNLRIDEMSKLYRMLMSRGSSRDLALVVDADQDIFTMEQMVIGRVERVNVFKMAVKAGGTRAVTTQVGDDLFEAVEVPDQRFTLTVQVTELATTDMV